VETVDLQRADQIESIVNTKDSDEARLSVAESLAQTFAPMAVPPSNLPNVGEDGLAIVEVSTLTTAEILDKRSSPSGVEYKSELEPLWMAADLVERVRRERTYTKGTQAAWTRYLDIPVHCQHDSISASHRERGNDRRS
jgi:hypothetical protein